MMATNMKKFVTALLALSLALGVTSVAFAQDTKPTTKSRSTKSKGAKHKKGHRHTAKKTTAAS